MDIDLTVVVGIDAVTIRQWEISLPTLRINRGWLWSRPWLIFYDKSAVKVDEIKRIGFANQLQRVPQVKCIPWPQDAKPSDYLSQRAMMLTGFIHVPPRFCETQWWMKIDTDAVALRPCQWLEAEWFQLDDAGRYNVWIASSWGYTKVKGDPGVTAMQWANRLEEFGDRMLPKTERLDLASKVNAANTKILMRRMASWLSFYNTNWTQLASEIAEEYSGRDLAPVGSQDTYHWYVATRMKCRTQLAKMKRFGWTNCPKEETLRRTAESILHRKEPYGFN